VCEPRSPQLDWPPSAHSWLSLWSPHVPLVSWPQGC
jgi:hypothetical protein